MKRIALLETLHPAATQALAEAAQVIEVAPEPEAAEVAGCAALITRGRGRITAATLADAGDGLRCVARVGAGVDNIAVEAATRRGVLVLHAPDAFTTTTAEHALLLMLAVARRVAEFDRAVHEGRWEARGELTGNQLAGRLLGLVGLGRIGRRVGELASALGMRVIAWSPNSRDARIPHVELDELLAKADVVSLHLALTGDTRGLLDAGRIARMKRGAILINTARGGLVDEAALAAALHAGRLAGAGLDVLGQEPPPRGHPLLGAPRTIITPHTAALTEESYRDACLAIVRQVLQVVGGKPPDPAHVVNRELLAKERS